jgi:hypothetical protein
MFPEHSGVYIAQKDNDIIVVKVKGVYPSLQLDKKAINLGEYLRTGKIVEVTQSQFDNLELFHAQWNFIPLDFINFGVFSKNKTDFAPNGADLYLEEEEVIALRGKYFRLCQQGVSPLKVIRAISYEYKVSTEQIIKLINGFDEQARTGFLHTI